MVNHLVNGLMKHLHLLKFQALQNLTWNPMIQQLEKNPIGMQLQPHIL
jgi:hypothetical protein